MKSSHNSEGSFEYLEEERRILKTSKKLEAYEYDKTIWYA